MSDDPAPYDHARAISASAEAVKAAVEQAGELGHYVGEVLGSAPHELMDIVTMHIRAFKVRSAIRLYGGTKRRLEEAGLRLADLRSPSASIEVPLLEAATMEDREVLTELWEKLLAAAIAPDSRNRVRVRYIEIVKALEPLDAWVLQNFDELVPLAMEIRTERDRASNARTMGSLGENELIGAVLRRVSAEADDVSISFEALGAQGLLIRDTLGTWGKTALARIFLSVVNSVKAKN